MQNRLMRSVMTLTALGALAVAPSVALGQNQVVRESDKTVYKQKTVIDFSDVTIEGELTKPEGSYLLNRKKTKFKTLLKIRANFIPELEYSTDNL